ncbi:hypothetical protein [Thalassococcus sp. S3]|uniref:hypothetical protein n=1 Tax=Thalassococcus sp. S3 TaxID=2017482 RepID=UPI0010241629|nr:hypothetical protein [Thalassococcus sp. S3]QBF31461.1 hypothetical protein CFI11_09550 [Thalassococcus sp. S3]
MTDLDGRLLAAHLANDVYLLADLYQEAAEQAADVDAACFYLTHAYVFALEAAHPARPVILKQLQTHGREP